MQSPDPEFQAAYEHGVAEHEGEYEDCTQGCQDDEPGRTLTQPGTPEDVCTNCKGSGMDATSHFDDQPAEPHACGYCQGGTYSGQSITGRGTSEPVDERPERPPSACRYCGAVLDHTVKHRCPTAPARREPS